MKSSFTRLLVLSLAAGFAASSAFAVPTDVFAFRAPNAPSRAKNPKNPDDNVFADYLVIQKNKIARYLCAMKDANDFPRTMDEFAASITEHPSPKGWCFLPKENGGRNLTKTYYVPRLKMYLFSTLEEFYRVERGDPRTTVGITPLVSTIRFDVSRPDYLQLSSAGIDHTAKSNSKIWTERLTYIRTGQFRGDFPALRVPDLESNR